MTARMAADGKIVPDDEHLKKLFMRKPDLPILRVCFPDGSRRVYWNTFYQKVEFDDIGPHDFAHIEGLHPDHATTIADTINQSIAENANLEEVDLGDLCTPQGRGALDPVPQARLPGPDGPECAL